MFLGGAMSTAAPLDSSSSPPLKTGIEEIVMYGVDSDTNELLRYNFRHDTYQIIAKMIDQNGNPILDVEGAGYIPYGDAQGLYCSPTKGAAMGKLAKIDLLDATCHVFSADVSGNGFLSCVGMKHWSTDEWGLLATNESNELIWVDPLTQTTTTLHTMSRRFEGLALAEDGTLFANTTTKLFEIDIANSFAEIEIGDHGFGKVESLEMAFGDDGGGIEIPGMDPGWMTNGTLMGFDDNSDAFLIFDPASGIAQQYNCAFATVDCEGIIIFTERLDPRGRILMTTND